MTPEERLQEETQIKREVHRLLGYRAALQGTYKVWDGSTREQWVMLSPDGEVLYSESDDSEEGVWVSAIDHYGTAYDLSVDMALTLPPPTPHAYLNQLALWYYDGEWFANYAGATIGGVHLGRDEHPAMAICKSWISYKKWALTNP